MPIYEYSCESCGHELEALQGVHDDLLTDCPECGAASLRKCISRVAFRLKGSGWYETDFKDKDKRNGAGDGGESASNSGGSEDQSGGSGQNSGSGGESSGASSSGESQGSGSGGGEGKASSSSSGGSGSGSSGGSQGED